jgi:hypothetical protein
MALLRKGSKGSDVVMLQEELNKLTSMAWPGRGDRWLVTDGKFGPLTKEWVRTFQAKAGIKVDGICGPQTWSKITEHVALFGADRPPRPRSPSEKPPKQTIPKAPPPKPDKSGKGKRVAKGRQALKLANELLVQCVDIRSSNGRQVLAKKGTFDKKTKILIIGRLGDSVVYLRNNELWLVPRRKFVKGLELGETAEIIVDSTRFIKSASEVTMSTLLGFAIGFTGVLGSVASVTVVVVKFMVFVDGRAHLVKNVNSSFGELVDTLLWIQRNMPETSPHIRSILWDSLKVDFWAAVSPKAIGPTFGKVLGMASGGKIGVEKTEFTFVKVVTLVATLFATMGLEAGKTIELSVDPQDFSRAQRELKGSVSEAERSRMEQELAKPGAQEKLQRLTELAHENVDFQTLHSKESQSFDRLYLRAAPKAQVSTRN